MISVTSREYIPVAMTSLQACSAQPGGQQREPGWFVCAGCAVWVSLGARPRLRKGLSLLN